MPTQESSEDDSQREVSVYKTNTTSRRQLLRLLGAGGLAGLAGCSAADDEGTETGTEPGADTATGTATTTGKELQQRATIGIPANITRDWQTVYGVSPYWHRMLEPLTWCTPEYKAKPWLATDWERTGKKTWEFNLRDDVTFHNGDPLNADAVVFSFKKLFTNPANGDFISGFANLKADGARKVDDLTVELTNTDPFPNMPERLTHLFFVVQHPDSSKDQKWGNVIGTGPYKEEELKPDDRLTVSAYDNYWRESQPKMEELTYRYIKDKNTRALALSGGELDAGLKLSPSQFDTLNNAKETNAVAQPTSWTAQLQFNNTKPPIDDVKLRKALNYAVSQKTIVNGALSGIGDPARGTVPPMIWWSAYDSLPEYGPDKAKAKQLVGESDYDGETLTIVSSSQPFVPENPKLAAQIFQQEAKAVGVDVEVKMLEPGAFDKAEEAGNGHIFQTGSLSSHALTYDLLAQFTSARVANHPYTFKADRQKKIDSLFKKGKTARDPAVTKDALGKLQHMLVEDVVIFIPMYYKKWVIGTRSNVAEFDWHPLKRYQRMERLEVRST